MQKGGGNAARGCIVECLIALLLLVGLFSLPNPLNFFVAIVMIAYFAYSLYQIGK